jgi:hypothetical protein
MWRRRRHDRHVGGRGRLRNFSEYGTNTTGGEAETAMQWCDLSCEHASFPKTAAVDGSGSCRTFAALYCAKLQRLVHKNGPCQCPEPPGRRGERA